VATNTCSFCQKRADKLLIRSPIDPKKAICSKCAVSAALVLEDDKPPPRPKRSKVVEMRRAK